MINIFADILIFEIMRERIVVDNEFVYRSHVAQSIDIHTMQDMIFPEYLGHCLLKLWLNPFFHTSDR